jgi:hypothetical protein
MPADTQVGSRKVLVMPQGRDVICVYCYAIQPGDICLRGAGEEVFVCHECQKKTCCKPIKSCAEIQCAGCSKLETQRDEAVIRANKSDKEVGYTRAQLQLANEQITALREQLVQQLAALREQLAQQLVSGRIEIQCVGCGATDIVPSTFRQPFKRSNPAEIYCPTCYAADEFAADSCPSTGMRTEMKCVDCGIVTNDWQQPNPQNPSEAYCRLCFSGREATGAALNSKASKRHA